MRELALKGLRNPARRATRKRSPQGTRQSRASWPFGHPSNAAGWSKSRPVPCCSDSTFGGRVSN
jgi:hypothetical protein